MGRKSEIRVSKFETNSKPKIQVTKIDFGLGLILLLVFLGLRLANLTKLPVFADEAIYIRWAQVMRAEASLRFLPLSDGKQPLFMWLMIPVLKLVADPLAAGRLLSVAAGLGTLAGVGILTWQLTKSRLAAWGASFVWAIIPFSVFFERMALVDSLLTMFFTWTLLLGVMAMKYGRWDLGMLTGFALGGTLLTKTPGVWLYGLLPMGAIISQKSKIKNQKSGGNLKGVVVEVIGRVVFLVPAYVVGYGMYNIMRLGPEFQMLAIRNRDYIFSLSEVLSHPGNPLMAHLKDIAGYMWLMGTPGVLLLGLIGVVWLIRERKLEILGWLVAWLVIPLVIQAGISRTMTARYLLFLMPSVAILAGMGLEQGWRWAREGIKNNELRIKGKDRSQNSEVGIRKLKGFAIAVVMVGVLVPILWFDYWLLVNPERVPLPRNERSGYLEEWTAGQGIKEAATFFKERAKEGNVLVGVEGWFGTPLNGVEMYLNQVPNTTVIGVGYPILNVSEKLTNALADNRVFLVVNKSRFLVDDPEAAGLQLVAEYPKAERPDGMRDELMVWEMRKSDIED
jgi:4-amino-4-deoxy-L-arabinose transferase-like glycosyltransferase